MKFKKGVSGNPAGRPVGSKDRKYLNLQYWFDRLEAELDAKIHVKEFYANGTFYKEYDRPAVDPNTRARLFMEGMKLLVSKMANLPKDSEESTSNAKALMEEIKALEGQFDRAGNPESDKGVLDNRPPTL